MRKISTVVLIMLITLLFHKPTEASTTDFDYETTPEGTVRITNYKGPMLSEVIVPKEIDGLVVTEIGPDSFKGRILESVTVLGDLDEVGDSAFWGTNIKTLTFKGSIETIKFHSIAGISETVVFEGDVGTIEEGSMQGIIQLLHFKGNIGTIKSKSISGIYNDFITDGNIDIIEDSGFQYAILSKFINKGTIGLIGSRVFEDGSWPDILEEITLNNIDKIDDEAFATKEIGDIVINGIIKNMGTTTFRESKINKFILKQDISELGGTMFLDATVGEFIAEGIVDKVGTGAFLRSKIGTLRFLKKVNSTANYSIQQSLIDTVVFEGDVGDIGEGTFLLGKYDSIHFKGNVGSLGESSFLNSKVENLTFDGSIGYIGGSSFISDDINEQYIGTLIVKGNIDELLDSSFLRVNVKVGITIEGNIGRTENGIFLSSNVPFLHVKGDIGNIGDSSFLYTKGSGFEGVKEIIVDGRVGILGDSSFVYAEMERFIVRKGIGEIGNSALLRSDIKELDIFTNTETIGTTSFLQAKFYKNLEVPDTVVKVGPNAFTNIDVPEFIYKARASVIPDNMFNSSRVLTYLEVPEPVIKIEEGAFRDVAIERMKSNKNLESIGEEAFINHKMSCVTLYPKVTSIGKDAFKSSFIDPSDFTIWGDKGSEAEAYAIANGHQFKENDVFSNDCNPGNWSIEIKALDIQGDIINVQTIDKPSLGKHVVKAEPILGYTVEGKDSVEVEINKITPSHQVTFTYKKLLPEIPKSPTIVIPPITPTPKPVPTNPTTVKPDITVSTNLEEKSCSKDAFEDSLIIPKNSDDKITSDKGFFTVDANKVSHKRDIYLYVTKKGDNIEITAKQSRLVFKYALEQYHTLIPIEINSECLKDKYLLRDDSLNSKAIPQKQIQKGIEVKISRSEKLKVLTSENLFDDIASSSYVSKLKERKIILDGDKLSDNLTYGQLSTITSRALGLYDKDRVVKNWKKEVGYENITADYLALINERYYKNKENDDVSAIELYNMIYRTGFYVSNRKINYDKYLKGYKYTDTIKIEEALNVLSKAYKDLGVI